MSHHIRILSKIEEQKLPQPDIQEIGMRVRFTANLKEVQPLTAEQSRKGRQAKPRSQQVGEQVGEQVDEQVAKVRK